MLLSMYQEATSICIYNSHTYSQHLSDSSLRNRVICQKNDIIPEDSRKKNFDLILTFAIFDI